MLNVAKNNLMPFEMVYDSRFVHEEGVRGRNRQHYRYDLLVKEVMGNEGWLIDKR